MHKSVIEKIDNCLNGLKGDRKEGKKKRIYSALLNAKHALIQSDREIADLKNQIAAYKAGLEKDGVLNPINYGKVTML